MTTCRLTLLFVLSACKAGALQPSVAVQESIASDVTRTDAGDLVLTQTALIDAPASQVWRAYTTAPGWQAWAAPAVQIDLRPGGTIRTHYGEGAAVGDPGTNTLHILNYVPERLLTLQAEVSDRWPEVMKEDASHLMNVIVFESLDEGHTRISSYGVGYQDSPAYDELMAYFIPANEGLLRKLKAHLESQEPAAP